MPVAVPVEFHLSNRSTNRVEFFFGAIQEGWDVYTYSIIQAPCWTIMRYIVSPINMDLAGIDLVLHTQWARIKRALQKLC